MKRPSARGGHDRLGRLLHAVLLGVLVAPGVHAVPQGTADVAAEASPAEASPDRAGETAGLKAQSIRLSSAGYMLDFRYRVVDPERAAAVIDHDTPLYLIDEASGARLRVPAPPKIGPLRSAAERLEADRTYFILFANPAKKIGRGDRVTVVLGQHRIEHLIVQ